MTSLKAKPVRQLTATKGPSSSSSDMAVLPRAQASLPRACMEPMASSRLRLGVLLATVVIISVVFLLADDVQLLRVSSAARTGNAAVPTPVPTRPRSPPPQNYNRTEDGDLAANFECVGWRRTGEASPDGWREPEFDGDCSAAITGCASGYCLFRHKTTRAKRRAMLMHSNSLPCHQTITCNMAASLLNYGYNAVSYKHDTAFRRDENQAIERYRVMWDVAHKNKSLAMITDSENELSFERGIVMVVHGPVLGTAFAAVRSLRSLGCRLPVEMWIRRDELQLDHPVLVELASKYGVFVREIADPRASRFYTKLHAVYYTVFDHMLLLDADNFAVRDPSYLFDTAEYQDTGAMFWPDFWRPQATTFHIVKEDLLWEVLGMDFVDMFEQESGQVLIDRRRHQKAIDVLMYYGFSLPRVVEEMQFEWGDKDLFRFAWLKTNSSFHFIQRPPGCGGRYHTEKQQFCGVSMVQHDPKGDVVFLHRNLEKMSAGWDNKLVWTHLQQFHVNASLDHFKLAHVNHVFDDIERCYGLDDHEKAYYDVTPMSEFPFADMETPLLEYAAEAGELMGMTQQPKTEPPPSPTPTPIPTSNPLEGSQQSSIDETESQNPHIGTDTS